MTEPDWDSVPLVAGSGGVLTLESDNGSELQGNFSGAGASFVKNGSAYMNMEGKMTHTGSTTINAGYLISGRRFEYSGDTTGATGFVGKGTGFKSLDFFSISLVY